MALLVVVRSRQRENLQEIHCVLAGRLFNLEIVGVDPGNAL